MNDTARAVAFHRHQLAPRLAREETRMAPATTKRRNHDRRLGAHEFLDDRGDRGARDMRMIDGPDEHAGDRRVRELRESETQRDDLLCIRIAANELRTEWTADARRQHGDDHPRAG